MLNAKIIEDFTSTQYEIEQAAEDMLSKINKIKPIEGYNTLSVNYIEESTIKFSGVTQSRCGDRDEYDYYMPADLLYDEESKSNLFKRLRQSVVDAAAKKLEIEQSKQSAKDERELKQYNELKQKFGETK